MPSPKYIFYPNGTKIERVEWNSAIGKEIRVTTTIWFKKKFACEFFMSKAPECDAFEFNENAPWMDADYHRSVLACSIRNNEQTRYWLRKAYNLK